MPAAVQPAAQAAALRIIKMFMIRKKKRFSRARTNFRSSKNSASALKSLRIIKIDRKFGLSFEKPSYHDADLPAQLKSARRQRVLIRTGAKDLGKTLKPWFYLFLDMAKKIRAIPEFSAAPLHQKK